MKWSLGSVFALLMMSAGSANFAPVEEVKWTFEDAKEGALPAKWTEAKTGDGPGSVWRIVKSKRDDQPTLALSQTSSEGPKPLYNLCVLAEEKRADVDLSVDVYAVKGEIDQGGGLVWRYLDANNYYIARWNPLEDNFRLYHVKDGKRTQLANADFKVEPEKWRTVRVTQKGNEIRCYFDGKPLLEAKDDTFKEAGAIGLWTKADAVTLFDNLSIGDAK